MSEFIVKKASKKAKKLRILFSASSGSGKTYGALLLAYGICKDWGKICVIDTERDSASLYADLGDFYTITLNAPYTPQRYIAAIKAAEDSGAEVIIVDSITHEWSGEGGCLELHSKLGGSFQDWGKVTPLHNKFIDAILTSTCHVLCTVRRKEEYAMTTGTNGKMQVQKLGLGEQTRDGFSYEMDIVFEISNNNHLSNVTKDRTNVFIGREEFLITKETGEELTNWAAQGRSELDDAMDKIRQSDSVDTLNVIFENYPSLHKNNDFMTSLRARREQLNTTVK